MCVALPALRMPASVPGRFFLIEHEVAIGPGIACQIEKPINAISPTVFVIIKLSTLFYEFRMATPSISPVLNDQDRNQTSQAIALPSQVRLTL